MPHKAGKEPEQPQSSLLKLAFEFFANVLKSAGEDPILRILWGVEVLLFVTLAFMVSFGGISADQRFYLSMLIIVLMVIVFVAIARGSQPVNGPPPPPPPPPLDRSWLLALAKKCHDQLVAIEAANTRIIERGRVRPDGLWGRMLNETYNPICRSCYERRRGNRPPDAFLDVICADTDLKAVCDRKWELGETLETYRKRLDEFVPPPAEPDELERLIRRSVTQEDRSATELDGAVKQSIAAAKRVIEQESSGASSPSLTGRPSRH